VPQAIWSEASNTDKSQRPILNKLNIERWILQKLIPQNDLKERKKLLKGKKKKARTIQVNLPNP